MRNQSHYSPIYHSSVIPTPKFLMSCLACIQVSQTQGPVMYPALINTPFLECPSAHPPPHTPTAAPPSPEVYHWPFLATIISSPFPYTQL